MDILTAKVDAPDSQVPDVYRKKGGILLDLQFLDSRVVALVEKERVLISTQDQENGLYKTIISKMRRDKPKKRSDAIVSCILSAMGYVMAEVRKIYNEVLALEKVVEKKLEDEHKQELVFIYSRLIFLLDCRRDLSYFKESLKKLRKWRVINEEKEYVLNEEISEVLSFVDLTINSVQSVLDLHDKIVSMNLNTLIKRLTSISIMLSVITIITGIFGMNFAYIPLKDHPLGFWITNAFMLLIFVLLYFTLRAVRYI